MSCLPVQPSSSLVQQAHAEVDMADCNKELYKVQLDVVHKTVDVDLARHQEALVLGEHQKAEEDHMVDNE
jgi:hypothetical protein